MNKPHKHWKEIAQYAQDAAETDSPWERWEYKNEDHPWRHLKDHPMWADAIQYRRKPSVIIINGIEVPEPMRQKLEVGTEYYMPSFCGDYVSANWDDDSFDNSRLELGICHLTREAAELHAKALLSFTKKEDTK